MRAALPIAQSLQPGPDNRDPHFPESVIMAETKEKTPKTPEQTAMRKAVRLVAYTAWLQDFRANNPDATADQRKVAWTAAKQGEIRKGRKIIKALKRKGYDLTKPERATEAA